MISTFDFIISFNEFSNNFEALIDEAKTPQSEFDLFYTVLAKEFSAKQFEVRNALQTNTFDQNAIRDSLNKLMQDIERTREVALNTFGKNSAYVFLNSLIDLWNEFVKEIGPRD